MGDKPLDGLQILDLPIRWWGFVENSSHGWTHHGLWICFFFPKFSKSEWIFHWFSFDYGNIKLNWTYHHNKSKQYNHWSHDAKAPPFNLKVPEEVAVACSSRDAPEHTRADGGAAKWASPKKERRWKHQNGGRNTIQTWFQLVYRNRKTVTGNKDCNMDSKSKEIWNKIQMAQAISSSPTARCHGHGYVWAPHRRGESGHHRTARKQPGVAKPAPNQVERTRI